MEAAGLLLRSSSLKAIFAELLSSGYKHCRTDKDRRAGKKKLWEGRQCS